VFGVLFLVLPVLLAPSDPDSEKVSTYECGFEAFDDARMKFDVQFYIVAILFIIVDLDVAFLFPWAVTLFNPELGLNRDFQIFSFWSMFIFLGVLQERRAITQRRRIRFLQNFLTNSRTVDISQRLLIV